MSTIPLDDAANLAMLFHLNSEPWMNQQAYDEAAAAALPPILTLDRAARVSLPSPRTIPWPRPRAGRPSSIVRSQASAPSMP